MTTLPPNPKFERKQIYTCIIFNKPKSSVDVECLFYRIRSYQVCEMSFLNILNDLNDVEHVCDMCTNIVWNL